MNKQKILKIILLIIAIIIVVAEIIVYAIKGVKMEFNYSNRQAITLSSGNELDISKIEDIAKEVLADRKVEVKKVERFNNAAQIISTSISDEEKESIVSKFNEAYSDDLESSEVDIVTISNTKIRDIIKHYIAPVLISFIIVLVYFVIVYHKIGVIKVILKSIIIEIALEAVLYGIIMIARIPFGDIATAITLGVYVLGIMIALMLFHSEKKKLEAIEDNNDKEVDE